MMLVSLVSKMIQCILERAWYEKSHENTIRDCKPLKQVDLN
jgi:hypothetical protein